jgi:hypothetical protein
VLAKKRDPATHQLLLEALDASAHGERDTRWFAAFWGKLMRAAVQLPY